MAEKMTNNIRTLKKIVESISIYIVYPIQTIYLLSSSYIKSPGNFLVVKIDPSGNVSNVVGCGYTENIRVKGDYLYIADQENNKIDQVDLTSLSFTVISFEGRNFSPEFGNISSVSITSHGKIIVGDASAEVSANQLRVMDDLGTEAVRLGVLLYPRVVSWDITQPLFTYSLWSSKVT